MPGQLTRAMGPGMVPSVGSTYKSNPFLPMKPPKSINLKNRAAAKAASRMADRERLKNGESPERIQQENSIFPPGFFENGRFKDLASSVGK